MQGRGRQVDLRLPDVCMTPPENPATPPGVPIPYPNTGLASDTTDGSRSVQISGKEIMLKNKSYFKKSIGDEAGCAAKKGVVTSVNRGKVYFIAWSMDVKVESENAVRHLDMTTHNHASPTPNTAPWTYADRMAMAKGLEECDGDRQRVKDDCGIDPNNPEDTKKSPTCPDPNNVKEAEAARRSAKRAAKDRHGTTPSGDLTADGERDPEYVAAKQKVKDEYQALADETAKDKCQEALRCFLSPQKPSRCCPKQTPHHVIPASAILKEGTRGASEATLTGFADYQSTKAPCICAYGPDADTAEHKKAHNAWADYTSTIASEAAFSYSDATSSSAPALSYEEAVFGAQLSVEAVAPHCDIDCIEAQVNQQHLGRKQATKEDKEKNVRRTMDDDHLQTDQDSDV